MDFRNGIVVSALGDQGLHPKLDLESAVPEKPCYPPRQGVDGVAQSPPSGEVPLPPAN